MASHPILHLKMDEGSGAFLEDVSVSDLDVLNNNHGRLRVWQVGCRIGFLRVSCGLNMP